MSQLIVDCAGHLAVIVRGLRFQPVGGEEGPVRCRRRRDQRGGHRAGPGYSILLL